LANGVDPPHNIAARVCRVRLTDVCGGLVVARHHDALVMAIDAVDDLGEVVADISQPPGREPGV